MCVGVGCEILWFFSFKVHNTKLNRLKRPSENILSVACFDLETAAVNAEFVFPINANNMWICWNRLWPESQCSSQEIHDNCNLFTN